MHLAAYHTARGLVAIRHQNEETDTLNGISQKAQCCVGKIRRHLVLLTSVPMVPAAFMTLSESSNSSMLVRSDKMRRASGWRWLVRLSTRKQPCSLSASVPRMYAALPATLQHQHSRVDFTIVKLRYLSLRTKTIECTLHVYHMKTLRGNT